MKNKKLLLLNFSFISIFFMSFLFSSLHSSYDNVSNNTVIEEPSYNLHKTLDIANFNNNTIVSFNLEANEDKIITLNADEKDANDVNVTNDVDIDNLENLNNEELKEDEADVKEDKADVKEDKVQIYANIGVSIAKEYVNIRKEANTNSKILGKLHNGAVATIITTDGDWYKIKSANIEGYVNKTYIKTGLSDKKLIKDYGIEKVKVLSKGLNVRSKADESSSKLAVIYENETYNIIKDDNSSNKKSSKWIKINLPLANQSGYIKSDYVDCIVEFEYAKEIEKAVTSPNTQTVKSLSKSSKTDVDNLNLDVDDLALLACLVYSEANGQTYEGKLAVANVVLNRVKSKRYPNSIKSVIYQKGQFSVVASGILKKNLQNYKNFNSTSQKASIKAAKEALAGNNNVEGRLFFNMYKPAARQGHDKKSTSIKIDGQLFW